MVIGLGQGGFIFKGIGIQRMQKRNRTILKRNSN